MKNKLKIRLLRHYNGLSQGQMAEKLHLSVAEYSRIENGLTALKPEVSEKLTVIFGRSLKDTDELPAIIETCLN